MPLVRVGIDLEDSFGLVCVANAAARSNFLERFEDCAEKIGKKKVLMSNSQFTSLSLASANVRVWK